MLQYCCEISSLSVSWPDKRLKPRGTIHVNVKINVLAINFCRPYKSTNKISFVICKGHLLAVTLMSTNSLWFELFKKIDYRRLWYDIFFLHNGGMFFVEFVFVSLFCSRFTMLWTHFANRKRDPNRIFTVRNCAEQFVLSTESMLFKLTACP